MGIYTQIYNIIYNTHLYYALVTVGRPCSCTYPFARARKGQLPSYQEMVTGVHFGKTENAFSPCSMLTQTTENNALKPYRIEPIFISKIFIMRSFLL